MSLVFLYVGIYTTFFWWPSFCRFKFSSLKHNVFYWEKINVIQKETKTCPLPAFFFWELATVSWKLQVFETTINCSYTIWASTRHNSLAPPGRSRRFYNYECASTVCNTRISGRKVPGKLDGTVLEDSIIFKRAWLWIRFLIRFQIYALVTG